MLKKILLISLLVVSVTGCASGFNKRCTMMPDELKLKPGWSYSGNGDDKNWGMQRVDTELVWKLK